MKGFVTDPPVSVKFRGIGPDADFDDTPGIVAALTGPFKVTVGDDGKTLDEHASDLRGKAQPILAVGLEEGITGAYPVLEGVPGFGGEGDDEAAFVPDTIAHLACGRDGPGRVASGSWLSARTLGLQRTNLWALATPSALQTLAARGFLGSRSDC